MFEEEQASDQLAEVEGLRAQLRQEQDTNLFLVESMAELEASMESEGWQRISSDSGQEFSSSGRKLLIDLCRTFAVKNPLIKRGLNLRISYIWGSAERSGVQVEARDDKVNDVVQRFWEDNTKTLTGSQAQEELERALGTDGGVFLAAFTSPLTGRVRIRSVPAAEITGIITNPDDRDEPWFYTREYTRTIIEPGYADGNTRTRQASVREAYPALGYRPTSRIKMINNYTINWDAPMQHIAVNRLDGWQFGVPDVYAAVAWAGAYKDFLTDWALLTKSLAKFAWKLSGDSRSRTAKAAAAIRANSDPTLLPPLGAGSGSAPAGAAVAAGPGSVLEAIPKSGAHIDAGSGKPLAAMVASGLGMPVTLLLADPGVTGARAVAETLDKPTVLEMGLRRMLWQSKLGELLDYAVDQAALAPKSTGLSGTQTVDDWDERTVTLTGVKDRNIDWNWPPLFELDPVQAVGAIVAADTTGLFEGDLAETIIRLLLNALGVEDVDEILEKMTDANGKFVDPRVSAGDAAAQRHQHGQDPASLYRDSQQIAQQDGG